MELARLYFIRHVRDSIAPDGMRRSKYISFDEMIQQIHSSKHAKYIELFIQYGMFMDQLHTIETFIPINMEWWHDINQKLMKCGLEMAMLNNASPGEIQLLHDEAMTYGVAAAPPPTNSSAAAAAPKPRRTRKKSMTYVK